MTQHWHFGFFLIITCSTFADDDAGTTIPCCTSNMVGEEGVDECPGAPLALALGVGEDKLSSIVDRCRRGSAAGSISVSGMPVCT